MADVSDKMIGIFVAAILTAALIPVAILQLANATLTNISGSGVNVDASVIALYGVLSIAVIVVIVVLFFKQV